MSRLMNRQRRMWRPEHRLSRSRRRWLPVLRFTPYVWAKLAWFCRRGEEEIGGFGVTDSGDALLVKDFVTVRQEVTPASVVFDDVSVAEHFERQVDLGRTPEQFARIWLHTHPGCSPVPSAIDEECFARVFGRCRWAVMFILAREGAVYARLRFDVGPRGQVRIPVRVDYGEPFAGSDEVAWEAEHGLNVHPKWMPVGRLAGHGLLWDRPEGPQGYGQESQPDGANGLGWAGANEMGQDRERGGDVVSAVDRQLR
jgi:proteasome lid subunit RPN8/RPN11